MKLPTAQQVHFDIDGYLNRYIPRSQLYRLPRPISRFLGYRASPQQEVGNVLVCVWAFIGAFAGLLLVMGVFKSSEMIQRHHPPIVIASLAATAILDYQTIQSPLAQPRSSIIGHVLAAIVGVGITKLFMLRSDFESLRWIAGAVCTAAASTAMGLTNTVHPPGGATAMLAAVDSTIIAMGWFFVPLVLIGSLLMLGTALVVNNIQRQFPMFWWTPRVVGRPKGPPDIEKTSEVPDGTMERTLSRAAASFGGNTIIITPHHVVIPDGFVLGLEEKGILEVLRDRLRGPENNNDDDWGNVENQSSHTEHTET
ncbi:HPP family protein [Aspergillus clavatus NRRL 1]|uniref:HPP family protein n=1 Tax=Aspergillus clavatus (strain ATCC 1007 / CBS 513.65 / DSM 816 / NCTC 3887 / NRRL 1 / QM 1276 / 107) TaxID=344612 RepID=A1CN78_ASPCL|nr:HPP family protein [Aspergillus clavatus NRRL 1]EAW07099.1 HPP family protein [Aspergillus clavatus NRRL 1]